MQRISEILQFPVVVERRWPLPFDPQPFQKFDFLRSHIAAERSIFEESVEPWLDPERSVEFRLNKLEPLRMSRDQSSVKHDLHGEVRQVDIPGLDQRIQEGNAVLQ